MPAMRNRAQAEIGAPRYRERRARKHREPPLLVRMMAALAVSGVALLAALGFEAD